MFHPLLVLRPESLLVQRNKVDAPGSGKRFHIRDHGSVALG